MFYLTFPKCTSAGWYSLEALLCLVASEWKRQLHDLGFYKFSRVHTVACLLRWSHVRVGKRRLERSHQLRLSSQFRGEVTGGKRDAAFIAWPPLITLETHRSAVPRGPCHSLHFCGLLPPKPQGPPAALSVDSELWPGDDMVRAHFH